MIVMAIKWRESVFIVYCALLQRYSSHPWCPFSFILRSLSDSRRLIFHVFIVLKLFPFALCRFPFPCRRKMASLGIVSMAFDFNAIMNVPSNVLAQIKPRGKVDHHKSWTDGLALGYLLPSKMVPHDQLDWPFLAINCINTQQYLILVKFKS